MYISLKEIVFMLLNVRAMVVCRHVISINTLFYVHVVWRDVNQYKDIVLCTCRLKRCESVWTYCFIRIECELWLYEKMWIGIRTLFYTHPILEQWSFEDMWKLLKELCLKFKWLASVFYLCNFTVYFWKREQYNRPATH